MADTEMIDVTDLFKRLCAESNIRYDGEKMIVPKDTWERWQYGLLREYLEADNDDEPNDAEG